GVNRAREIGQQPLEFGTVQRTEVYPLFARFRGAGPELRRKQETPAVRQTPRPAVQPVSTLETCERSDSAAVRGHAEQTGLTGKGDRSIGAPCAAVAIPWADVVGNEPDGSAIGRPNAHTPTR